MPAGTAQPDTFLFERGNEALTRKKWMTAREYFQTIVETYPQSTHRADAKLGVGDSLLGEGTAAAQIQAIQEFREFLSFFPTHARADYAQYKLAMAHYYQMAKPERDQTETREAIREFDIFFERYPNSTIRPEAEKHYRETRDRLSESEYRVGLFYHRAKWYPGAIDRFQQVLKIRSEIHQSRRGVFLSERSARQDEPAGRSRAAADEARRRVRGQRIPGAARRSCSPRSRPRPPCSRPPRRKADGDKPNDRSRSEASRQAEDVGTRRRLAQERRGAGRG